MQFLLPPYRAQCAMQLATTTDSIRAAALRMEQTSTSPKHHKAYSSYWPAPAGVPAGAPAGAPALHSVARRAARQRRWTRTRIRTRTRCQRYREVKVRSASQGQRWKPSGQICEHLLKFSECLAHDPLPLPFPPALHPSHLHTTGQLVHDKSSY